MAFPCFGVVVLDRNCEDPDLDRHWLLMSRKGHYFILLDNLPNLKTLTNAVRVLKLQATW